MVSSGDSKTPACLKKHERVRHKRSHEVWYLQQSRRNWPTCAVDAREGHIQQTSTGLAKARNEKRMVKYTA